MKAVDCQLDMFEVPHIVYKPRYYKDLNIHERINVKANSQGFAHNYINCLRPGFDHVHIIMRDEHPEKIDRFLELWNLKHNHDSISTILWRQKYNEEKLTLKLK